MPGHVPFPSIQGLKHVVAAHDDVDDKLKTAQGKGGDDMQEIVRKLQKVKLQYEVDVAFRAKVKLHGTNAGVQLHRRGDDDLEVVVQSRNHILTAGGGLQGFQTWASSELVRPTFARCVRALELRYPEMTSCCVFGEWCGPGVQPNVALSQLKHRVFVVFAILVRGEELDGGSYVVDPHAISSVLGTPLPDHMHVLGWHEKEGGAVRLRLNDKADMEGSGSLQAINKAVEGIDVECPFVKDEYGLSGPGEGLVYYPMSMATADGRLTANHMSNFVFKAKGVSHCVAKQKQPAEVDVDAVKHAEEFVHMFVTEARLMQGLGEVFSEKNGGTAPNKAMMRHTKSFIDWVMKDAMKESEVERRRGGMCMDKKVISAVNKRAVAWLKTYAAQPTP